MGETVQHVAELTDIAVLEEIYVCHRHFSQVTPSRDQKNLFSVPLPMISYTAI